MARSEKSPVASNGSSVIPPSEHFFQLNEIRSATDADFKYFIQLADEHGDGWVKRLDKDNFTIWQKETGVSSIKMAKVCGEFVGVSAGTAFDTILDGGYRKTWDENVIEDYELCRLDDWNDVGYYSMKCPMPLRNRDFVNQRSWKMVDENQYIIFNHSVSIKDIPLKRRFIRGISYITGFLIRTSERGCTINYVTQSDPKGKIPSWIINLAINQIAPSVFRKLYMAVCKYEEWKVSNNPEYKPWRYPEQNTLKVLDAAALQGNAVTSAENQPLADQEEDLPEDENEMKEIANKIAKQLSLDEEPQNGEGEACSNGDVG